MKRSVEICRHMGLGVTLFRKRIEVSSPKINIIKELLWDSHVSQSFFSCQWVLTDTFLLVANEDLCAAAVACSAAAVFVAAAVD